MAESKSDERLIVTLFEFAKVLFFIYIFLVSIDLMGMGFRYSGKEFTDTLFKMTSNPFIGLVIGIVVTSIIQSSSTTTSIIVAMVGAGAIPLKSAIPMVMGANIGTTVTNTIVSFGYVGRKTEFERTFGVSIVHDMFNIYATLVLFPIELYTGIIYKSALFLEKIFKDMGGFKFTSPLKIIINPVSTPTVNFINNNHVLIFFALVLLFFSITRIVKNMKGIVMEKIEMVLNQYLFRNAIISILFGIFFTALVQSSSITTSIIIPLVGAGLLTMEQIFPYTLGANIGTTITALLAALSVGKEAAMTIAICHLVFNVLGIFLFYPLRIIPIWTAKTIASYVSKSKKHFLIFLVIYILLHIIPIVFAKLY